MLYPSLFALDAPPRPPRGEVREEERKNRKKKGTVVDCCFFSRLKELSRIRYCSPFNKAEASYGFEATEGGEGGGIKKRAPTSLNPSSRRKLLVEEEGGGRKTRKNQDCSHSTRHRRDNNCICKQRKNWKEKGDKATTGFLSLSVHTPDGRKGRRGNFDIVTCRR